MEAAAWAVSVLAAAGAAEPIAFVVCAPGYPGSTREAQPVMDTFAAALAEKAGRSGGGVVAVYHETEAGGLERLARPDAALALAPLPFFLKHEARLQLQPRAQAVPSGATASEVWSLVARRGAVASAAALEGWELLSPAAYAPRFVRGTALGGWGALPAGTKLVQTSAVLTGLRRAASGERVVLLLDHAQAAALPTLPFAQDIEVVARSQPVPAVVVCTVGARLPAPRARALLRALLEMHERPPGAAALRGLQMDRFAPLDEAGLARARRAYESAKDPP